MHIKKTYSLIPDMIQKKIIAKLKNTTVKPKIVKPKNN